MEIAGYHYMCDPYMHDKGGNSGVIVLQFLTEISGGLFFNELLSNSYDVNTTLLKIYFLIADTIISHNFTHYLDLIHLNLNIDYDYDKNNITRFDIFITETKKMLKIYFEKIISSKEYNELIICTGYSPGLYDYINQGHLIGLYYKIENENVTCAISDSNYETYKTKTLDKNDFVTLLIELVNLNFRIKTCTNKDFYNIINNFVTCKISTYIEKEYVMYTGKKIRINNGQIILDRQISGSCSFYGIIYTLIYYIITTNHEKLDTELRKLERLILDYNKESILETANKNLYNNLVKIYNIVEPEDSNHIIIEPFKFINKINFGTIYPLPNITVKITRNIPSFITSLIDVYNDMCNNVNNMNIINNIKRLSELFVRYWEEFQNYFINFDNILIFNDASYFVYVAYIISYTFNSILCEYIIYINNIQTLSLTDCKLILSSIKEIISELNKTPLKHVSFNFKLFTYFALKIHMFTGKIIEQKRKQGNKHSSNDTLNIVKYVMKKYNNVVNKTYKYMIDYEGYVVYMINMYKVYITKIAHIFGNDSYEMFYLFTLYCEDKQLKINDLCDINKINIGNNHHYVGINNIILTEKDSYTYNIFYIVDNLDNYNTLNKLLEYVDLDHLLSQFVNINIDISKYIIHIDTPDSREIVPIDHNIQYIHNCIIHNYDTIKNDIVNYSNKTLIIVLHFMLLSDNRDKIIQQEFINKIQFNDRLNNNDNNIIFHISNLCLLLGQQDLVKLNNIKQGTSISYELYAYYTLKYNITEYVYKFFDIDMKKNNKIIVQNIEYNLVKSIDKKNYDLTKIFEITNDMFNNNSYEIYEMYHNNMYDSRLYINIETDSFISKYLNKHTYCLYDPYTHDLTFYDKIGIDYFIYDGEDMIYYGEEYDSMVIKMGTKYFDNLNLNYFCFNDRYNSTYIVKTDININFIFDINKKLINIEINNIKYNINNDTPYGIWTSSMDNCFIVNNNNDNYILLLNYNLDKLKESIGEIFKSIFNVIHTTIDINKSDKIADLLNNSDKFCLIKLHQQGYYPIFKSTKEINQYLFYLIMYHNDVCIDRIFNTALNMNINDQNEYSKIFWYFVDLSVFNSPFNYKYSKYAQDIIELYNCISINKIDTNVKLINYETKKIYYDKISQNNIIDNSIINNILSTFNKLYDELNKIYINGTKPQNELVFDHTTQSTLIKKYIECLQNISTYCKVDYECKIKENTNMNLLNNFTDKIYFDDDFIKKIYDDAHLYCKQYIKFDSNIKIDLPNLNYDYLSSYTNNMLLPKKYDLKSVIELCLKNTIDIINNNTHDGLTNLKDIALESLTDEFVNFCTVFGYFIRYDQFNVYKKILSESECNIHQLLMGRGKSSVIVPLLIYNKIQTSNIIIVVPTHLVEQTYNTIMQHIYNLNDVSIIKITNVKYTNNFVQKQFTDNDKKFILIISDYALKLLKINLINNNCDIGFIKNAYMIFDEIDAIIYPLSSDVNLVMKTKSVEHINFFVPFLFDVFYYLKKNKSENNTKQIFSHIINKYPDSNYIHGYNEWVNGRHEQYPSIVGHYQKYFDLIRQTAKLKDNDEYGFDPDENICVPYKGKNNPVIGSQYEDVYMVILLTIKLYINRWWVSKIMKNIIIDYKMCDDESDFIELINILNKDSKILYNLAHDIITIESLNLSEIQILDILKFYTIKYVFSKITISTEQYSISGIDLLPSEFTESKTAFSGTVTMLLPEPVEIYNIHKINVDQMTNGAIINALFGQLYGNPGIIKYNLIDDLILSNITDKCTQLNANVIIDASSILRYYNSTIIHEQMKSKLKKDYCIYPTNNGIKIWDGINENKFDTSIIINDKYCAYIPYPYTTGTDLKFIDNTCALLLIDDTITLSIMSQAIFRLRKLNYVHKFHYVYVGELFQNINSAFDIFKLALINEYKILNTSYKNKFLTQNLITNLRCDHLPKFELHSVNTNIKDKLIHYEPKIYDYDYVMRINKHTIDNYNIDPFLILLIKYGYNNKLYSDMYLRYTKNKDNQQNNVVNMDMNISLQQEQQIEHEIKYNYTSIQQKNTFNYSINSIYIKDANIYRSNFTNIIEELNYFNITLSYLVVHDIVLNNPLYYSMIVRFCKNDNIDRSKLYTVEEKIILMSSVNYYYIKRKNDILIIDPYEFNYLITQNFELDIYCVNGTKVYKEYIKIKPSVQELIVYVVVGKELTLYQAYTVWKYFISNEMDINKLKSIILKFGGFYGVGNFNSALYKFIEFTKNTKFTKEFFDKENYDIKYFINYFKNTSLQKKYKLYKFKYI